MARPINGRSALDSDDESLLYQGANLSQLATLFRADHRSLKERMAGIAPVGKRAGVPIFAVHEVAARMGKMTEEQVDAAVKRLNHADLPKQLTKEFWAGLKSKQDYELRAGELWPTGRVVMEVSELLKSLKMELDLTIDAIERQSEMSDRQRAVAKSIINGAKANMLKRIQEKFLDALPKAQAEQIVVIEDDDEL